MRDAIRRLIVAGAVLALGLPSPAWAADRDPQQITWQQVSDLVVGQFAAIDAQSSSGLDVSVRAEGACEVREVDPRPVVVAVSAGTCVLLATQDGDARFAPAPSVSQAFEFRPAETDVSLVVPGPDVIAPGDALAVYVSVAGEDGDDPAPGGTVVLQVRDEGGREAARREATLDAAGHALATVPSSVTAGWTDGTYQLVGSYAGDDSFLPSQSESLPVRVSRIECPAGADCGVEPVRGEGGITMTFDQPSAVAGEPVTVTLSGFPRNGIRVVFTLTDPRQWPYGDEESVQSRNGRASLTFPTGPKGTSGAIEVEAWYAFSDSERGYTDTLEVRYPVHARKADLWLEPPNQGKSEDWVAYDPGITENGLKTAKATVWFGWDGTTEPTVTGVDPRGRPCPYLHIADRRYQNRQPVEFLTWDWCRLTLSLPETPEVQGTTVTFTVHAQCRSRRGWYECPEGGEPLEGSLRPGPRADFSGRTVVVDGKPAPRRDEAPVVVADVGQALHVRVPWPIAGDILAVSEWRDGRWRPVGSAVVDARGLASLPTLQVEAVGTRELRLVGETTGYLRVTADAAS